MTLSDLQDKAFWRQLPVLLQIKPDGDILPARAPYDGRSRTIGLNNIKVPFPMWFTLADCIASKLKTGKAPRVVSAIRFTPRAMQEDLKPIKLAGAIPIDPTSDDFYRELIVRRGTIQAEIKGTDSPPLKALLDSQQMMLKLLANSTSYGIFAEQNVQSHDRPRRVMFHGQDEVFETASKSIEEPGSHFNPLIATFITGGARLMLACAERVAGDQGLGWAFCDTDSLAIAKPKDMADAEFLKRCEAVTGWFDRLDPYGDGKPLFKVEDQNFALDENGEPTREYCPLFAVCISAKRYVLFNLYKCGRPIIRKAVAHGLGHLMEPYEPEEAPTSIPAPVVDLDKLELKRWQYDLWYRIAEAFVDGHPDQVDLSGMPHLDRPARSRYGANTAPLLSWFKRFNEGKPLHDQVRSFNFMLAYQVSKPGYAQALAEDELEDWMADDGMPAVVAPFNDDPDEAVKHCFDRRTGKPVPKSILKTYREAIADYHLHSESKFENGTLFDTGPTRRREIEVVALEYIGKEANRWEEQFYLGELPEAQIEYGMSKANIARIVTMLRKASERFTQAGIAETAGISRQQLNVILNGNAGARSITLKRLVAAVAELNR